MAGMNPADYQGYVKGLNIKLPNMPASAGAQPPSPPSNTTAPSTTMPQAAPTSNVPSAPVGGPPYPPSTPMNMPPKYSDSQLSAQSWINNPNSGQGGIDAYTATQNQRYADAYKTGNQDLLGRLQNDSQRVGYTLNMPQAAPVQASTAVAAPPPSTPAPYGQLSPDQIKAEAQAQIAKQIAERTRIATQTKAGYQTSYDRMNQNIGEDRTLENVQNQRTLNPFSGHSDYAQGMIAMQRGRQDTQNQQDLQTRLGNVDSTLGDWLNQTPEQQQQIIDNLTKQERDYGLQVGTLTGNLQGYGRTLAGSAQDANYTGMYNGQQTLQAQNQAFNQAMASKDANWNAYKDTVGMTGNLGSGPKSDWGQLPGQTGAPSYQSVQDAIKNGMSQQQIDNAASQFAKQMGYNYANMNANDKQAWAQIAISQQNAATSSSNAAWAKDPNNPDNLYKQSEIAKNNEPKAKTPDSYKTDPNFATDVAHMKSNPADASKLESNAQAFIDAYGYDGYQALRKAANLD